MEAKKFCEGINKCKDDLYILALAILKNEADAEDAVSNAILKAYENRKQVSAFHKFKPWMMAITNNEALKIKKKRLYLPGDEALEALSKPVMAHYDELWDILQNMKEEYRLVIVSFYYAGLSIKDISDVLDIPAGTVKSRLSRGKAELREALERGRRNG
ncbi:sigma-70 family RNA polymerase sigma factor [bacterium D16-51]|nr:sigma-70 family RNA polymerase sigma factor [bacterium D16-59]RKI59796.1 sigma-70 family RNA polymerase sigma factor [bacterium D16-51]